MDIKEKLTQQEKETFSNLQLEARVLNALFNERKAMLENLLRQTFKRLNLDPTLYSLEFNPAQDKWEARLQKGALIIPVPITQNSKRN